MRLESNLQSERGLQRRWSWSPAGTKMEKEGTKMEKGQGAKAVLRESLVAHKGKTFFS